MCEDGLLSLENVIFSPLHKNFDCHFDLIETKKLTLSQRLFLENLLRGLK